MLPVLLRNMQLTCDPEEYSSATWRSSVRFPVLWSARGVMERSIQFRKPVFISAIWRQIPHAKPSQDPSSRQDDGRLFTERLFFFPAYRHQNPLWSVFAIVDLRFPWWWKPLFQIAFLHLLWMSVHDGEYLSLAIKKTVWNSYGESKWQLVLTNMEFVW